MPGGVDPVRHPGIYLEAPHFQPVDGLRAFDGYRAGNYMGSFAFLLHLLEDHELIVQNLTLRDAPAGEEIVRVALIRQYAFVRDLLYGNHVSGGHREHRLRVAVRQEPPPDDLRPAGRSATGECSLRVHSYL